MGRTVIRNPLFFRSGGLTLMYRKGSAPETRIREQGKQNMKAGNFAFTVF
jgi:hypothetical protein